MVNSVDIVHKTTKSCKYHSRISIRRKSLKIAFTGTMFDNTDKR